MSRSIAAAVLLVALVDAPVRAQSQVQATVGAGLGWSNSQDAAAPQADPAAASRGSIYLDLRPGLALQYTGLRNVVRLSYLFGGMLFLDAPDNNSYSNRLDLSLAAAPSARTTLVLSASGTMGGTNFQLTQRSPELAQPMLLAPAAPVLLMGNLTEALTWEATPRVRVTQRLIGTSSAPQCALDRRSYNAEAALNVDYLSRGDAIGADFRLSYGELSQVIACGGDATAAATTPNQVSTVSARWRHDFGPRWNLLAMLGLTSTVVLAGPTPLSLQPTGSAILTYQSPTGLLALSGTRATMANSFTGTLSTTDAVALRAMTTLGQTRPVQLSGSIGYSLAEPIGPTPVGTPGLGSAIVGDVGFNWVALPELTLTARYTAQLQFPQIEGGNYITIHIVTVGLLARYSSSPRSTPSPAMTSNRVDGAGQFQFPDAHSAPADAKAPARD